MGTRMPRGIGWPECADTGGRESTASAEAAGCRTPRASTGVPTQQTRLTARALSAGRVLSGLAHQIPE